MTKIRGIEDRSRDELALLVREYFLAGHLIDRAGMPHAMGVGGVDGMRDVAIDEWMGASPIYTRRMQRALDFVGTDVATIFKGMQLDVGAPPQFMDFRYDVRDAAYGEFTLASCGALMDVEPMGDELVVAMCHHIEDPTFDATAYASNPRARMLPIHRPPRVPTDRHPHCHWVVEIDPETTALEEPKATRRMADSRAAGVAIPVLPEDGTGGRTDYSGPLDEDFRFEEFSRSTLLTIAGEACLQGHLLSMSFAAAVAERWGADTAIEIGVKQLTGVGAVVATRLQRALGLGDALDDIATILELHPAFHPRAYVDWHVDTSRGLVVRLGECDALEEEVAPSWLGLLVNNSSPLGAIVQAVNPCAQVVAVSAADGGTAWEIVLGDVPASEPPEVTLTRFSTGAEFVFQAR